MTVTLTENRNSRTNSMTPPSSEYQYWASGTTSESEVRVAAVASTASSIVDERGTLYRQDVQVAPRGYAQWTVTVPYGPRKKESGNYSISFDTTGGTVHITTARSTASKWARPNQPNPPDMGGLIGVNGDAVDGTEQVIPSLKITVDFTHPKAIITIAQIKNLARWTGKYNSAPFLTFAAGEVLFLGATGREGTDNETTVTYQFAASENQNGLQFGDITVGSKKGWQYAWVSWEDHVENDLPAKRPRWVYVQDIYEGINLAAALGFGG